MFSKSTSTSSGNLRYGLVDGPGAERLHALFTKALTAQFGRKRPEVLFPRLSGDAAEADPPGVDALSVRKIRIFDAIWHFEKQGIDTVLLPDFSSAALIDEIETEVSVQIVDMQRALLRYLYDKYLPGDRVGVLCASRLRKEGFFARFSRWTLLYPARGIDGASAEPLPEACQDLMGQGAQTIVVADAALSILVENLQERGFPVVDALQIQAEYAARVQPETTRPFKIGIVGGVGPAATVDFFDKIVRNTPAGRDQEHFKIVIEQNPQISDRTAHLLNGGPDPTIALYAACKRLEADGASLIAIPCNTAHAFVGRIQPFLSIPIINMLRETADHIRRHHGECTKVGLLATSGTIESRVYHEVIVPDGFELLVPDAKNQKRVMNAIYGPKGVKAGFTAGECTDDLLAALTSLVRRGADAIILGCTELPLLLAQNDAFPVDGGTVPVLDPTDILARKCVSLGERALGR
ncbi:MAG: amino acid racemase [Candidatus Accumulibacter sp.]|nr:amino acid racemase [Accumulibacter sp.]